MSPSCANCMLSKHLGDPLPQMQALVLWTSFEVQGSKESTLVSMKDTSCNRAYN